MIEVSEETGALCLKLSELFLTIESVHSLRINSYENYLHECMPLLGTRYRSYCLILRYSVVSEISRIAAAFRRLCSASLRAFLMASSS